jgi:hypothetical protein
VRAVVTLDPENALCGQFWGGGSHPGEQVLRRIGGRARNQFINATPGLRALRTNLSAEHHQHGWVTGLDGRRIPTGADYKALNRIVTSSEAILCKRWLIDVHDELCERFRYGTDGEVYLALWVHDELVAICSPEIAETVGEIMIRHARAAGAPYEFRVPLDAEFKIGQSWAGEPAGTPQDDISAASQAIEGGARFAERRPAAPRGTRRHCDGGDRDRAPAVPAARRRDRSAARQRQDLLSIPR